MGEPPGRYEGVELAGAEPERRGLGELGDFRFFEPDEVAAHGDGRIPGRGGLERVSYPGEVETRRGYLLARRRT